MKENKIGSFQEKCQNCGANLRFSPKNQNLVCENCGSNFAIVNNAKIVYHNLKTQSDKEDAEYKKYVEQNKIFKCTNCGANVVLNRLEIAKNCPYCGTALVIDKAEKLGLKPDSIIPFMFDENDASEKFAETIKKRFFAPTKFKKRLPQNMIKGIYFPSFGYDALVKSQYKGLLYNEIEETDMEGNRNTRREFFPISGVLENEYKNIVVECSSHITQRQLDGFLPYDYNSKKPYSNSYILGYNVEQYENTVQDCARIYRTKLDAKIRRDILSRYHYDGVSNLDIKTDYQKEDYLYHILPVYKFEYDYKNKKYITYMNGQTGKVDGNTPKSGLKIALVVVLPILIILAIILICSLSNV